MNLIFLFKTLKCALFIYLDIFIVCLTSSSIPMIFKEQSRLHYFCEDNLFQQSPVKVKCFVSDRLRDLQAIIKDMLMHIKLYNIFLDF